MSDEYPSSFSSLAEEYWVCLTILSKYIKRKAEMKYIYVNVIDKASLFNSINELYHQKENRDHKRALDSWEKN